MRRKIPIVFTFSAALLKFVYQSFPFLFPNYGSTSPRILIAQEAAVSSYALRTK
ncbi:hypothetical protein RUMHYD_01631 [Blautia hydrogenotrophica DSM 10507]|uniref:Uncharacterized protein n=1 Tax=Blautia hydrogenotrophica (strain DSM 10507 / JCM 14656 / S5a33) TaxID=476272 RepID=C0CLB0_BLAHS|nr:hypothetical protein RUMHYD_01631 [Blautia hydrogenotrophica DSM 10507]